MTYFNAYLTYLFLLGEIALSTCISPFPPDLWEKSISKFLIPKEYTKSIRVHHIQPNWKETLLVEERTEWVGKKAAWVSSCFLSSNICWPAKMSRFTLCSRGTQCTFLTQHLSSGLYFNRMLVRPPRGLSVFVVFQTCVFIKEYLHWDFANLGRTCVLVWLPSIKVVLAVAIGILPEAPTTLKFWSYFFCLC